MVVVNSQHRQLQELKNRPAVPDSVQATLRALQERILQLEASDDAANTVAPLSRDPPVTAATVSTPAVMATDETLPDPVPGFFADPLAIGE